MRMLVLDCEFVDEYAVQAYDSEKNLIPLEAVFEDAYRVEVLLVNLPGYPGKSKEASVVVPAAVARVLLAGVRAMTANPEAKTTDPTN